MTTSGACVAVGVGVEVGVTVGVEVSVGVGIGVGVAVGTGVIVTVGTGVAVGAGWLVTGTAPFLANVMVAPLLLTDEAVMMKAPPCTETDWP